MGPTNFRGLGQLVIVFQDEMATRRDKGLKISTVPQKRFVCQAQTYTQIKQN